MVRPAIRSAAASLFAVAIVLSAGAAVSAAEDPVVVPPPTGEVTLADEGPATVVFAGGCFWGVQAVFQHTEGVISAVSGYAGGSVTNPGYEQVGTGTTGHAESVEVKFDPAKVSYGKLMQIFFSVAHDPTQLNYQGPDHGTQYRSAVFTTNDAELAATRAYIDQLDAARVFAGKIVTEVKPLDAFYPAEDYHQDYATLHPRQPYIAWNDLPKLYNLKTMFPDVWREQPVLVFAGNGT